MPFIDCLTKASSTLKTYWVVCRKHSLENREYLLLWPWLWKWYREKAEKNITLLIIVYTCKSWAVSLVYTCNFFLSLFITCCLRLIMKSVTCNKIACMTQTCTIFTCTCTCTFSKVVCAIQYFYLSLFLMTRWCHSLFDVDRRNSKIRELLRTFATCILKS